MLEDGSAEWREGRGVGGGKGVDSGKGVGGGKRLDSRRIAKLRAMQIPHNSDPAPLTTLDGELCEHEEGVAGHRESLYDKRAAEDLRRRGEWRVESGEQ